MLCCASSKKQHRAAASETVQLQQLVGIKSVGKHELRTSVFIHVLVCMVWVGAGGLSVAGIAEGFNTFPGFA